MQPIPVCPVKNKKSLWRIEDELFRPILFHLTCFALNFHLPQAHTQTLLSTGGGGGDGGGTVCGNRGGCVWSFAMEKWDLFCSQRDDSSENLYLPPFFISLSFSFFNWNTHSLAHTHLTHARRFLCLFFTRILIWHTHSHTLVHTLTASLSTQDISCLSRNMSNHTQCSTRAQFHQHSMYSFGSGVTKSLPPSWEVTDPLSVTI